MGIWAVFVLFFDDVIVVNKTKHIERMGGFKDPKFPPNTVVGITSCKCQWIEERPYFIKITFIYDL